MSPQSCWLRELLAALVTLKVLLSGVGHFVVLPGIRVGERFLTIAAGVIASLLVNGTHVLLEARGAVADLGAHGARPAALQRMEVNVLTQLLLCGLPQATVGTAVVLNALMSHHMDPELLLADEPQRAVRHIAGEGQLYLVAMRVPMVGQGGQILEHAAAELADVLL